MWRRRWRHENGKYYDDNFNEVVTIHNVEIFSPDNTFKTIAGIYLRLHQPWIEANVSGKCFSGQHWCNAKWSWVYEFENEIDAMAFKLRWL